jgi:hypothetical protein
VVADASTAAEAGKPADSTLDAVAGLFSATFVAVGGCPPPPKTSRLNSE